MAEVNWDEAPEGTTHLLYGVWRKIHGDDHDYWDKNLNDWVDYGINNGQELIRVHKEFIIERPQAPQVVVINGVEVDWGKAPEGTTHALVDAFAIKRYGQWRKVGEHEVWKWVGGEWVNHSNWPKMWLEVNRGLFIEKPGLVAGVKKEQAAPVKVAPKKPIGWWS